MTRDELEHIHETTLHMAETPQRATLKSYVYRLVEALEAAWARVDELERGEYICTKCGLRKDADAPGEIDW